MTEQIAGIRRATAEDGVTAFGPYTMVDMGPWARFVYFEFPDIASLFRLEDRLQEIDYMNYVDFENHLGRIYYGPDESDIRGEQPFCVAALAWHGDAWYSHPREERERIECEEIVPPLGQVIEAGGAFLALNICDITQGPRQFFLWEAPSLDIVMDSREYWNGFWRHHRGAHMFIGRKDE